MMNLLTMPNLTGGHLGGWRHKDNWSDIIMNFDRIVELTRIAERGKFDAIFLADGNAVREMDKTELFAANWPSARPVGFEPVTLLTALSQHTKHIGLAATATTTYEEPYLLARKFASLDHLSKGRAGWNVVTTSNAGDSQNFGLEQHVARDIRYERAREFVEVAKGLWDSWADDAFPVDKASGRFLEPSRVHTLNHEGTHFKVKGPLNITRPPQGYPVMFMAGQSQPGRELAAQYADALFGAGDTKESCQEVYADIKRRMAKYGRDPDHLRIIPGVSFFVGRTSAEAQEHYEELQSLISPSLGVHYLSKIVFKDLSGYPIDGPMPEIDEEVVGGTSLRSYILDFAKRDKLTIRQTYERTVPSIGHAVFKGTATEVADQMEDWYRGKACDGFMVSVPTVPRGLSDFVDLVVPELQRRGLFRKDYGGPTLRETMGLPIPENPVFSVPAIAAE